MSDPRKRHRSPKPAFSKKIIIVGEDEATATGAFAATYDHPPEQLSKDSGIRIACSTIQEYDDVKISAKKGSVGLVAINVTKKKEEPSASQKNINQNVSKKTAAASETVTGNQKDLICKKMAYDWKELARKLNRDIFSEAKLKEIERNHASNVCEQMTEMLEIWTNELGREATQKLMFKALKASGHTKQTEEIFPHLL
eukprot:m.18485 g.18485  ORF g.18485 m.18485 type:complete len:198 (+) comp27666_c0_seq2:40-633(+)